MQLHARVAASAATRHALALAGGSAFANEFHSSSTTFRIVWTPFISRIGINTIECNLTFEGVLHAREFEKFADQLIGQITRARATRPCGGANSMWVLNGTEELGGGQTAPDSLPWHVTYKYFDGTLPTITRIAVAMVGVSFLYEFGSIRCLYRSTVAAPFVGIFELNADGTILGFRADESIALPTTTRMCIGSAIRPQGIGGVAVTGTSTAIDIVLI